MQTRLLPTWLCVRSRVACDLTSSFGGVGRTDISFTSGLCVNSAVGGQNVSQLVSGKCGTHGTVKRDKPPGLYVNCNPHPTQAAPFRRSSARIGGSTRYNGSGRRCPALSRLARKHATRGERCVNHILGRNPQLLMYNDRNNATQVLQDMGRGRVHRQQD